jgi:ribosomal protein S18 acetylase RimI-like enzyme
VEPGETLNQAASPVFIHKKKGVFRLKIKKAMLDDINEVANLFNLYRDFYQQPSDIEGAVRFIETRMVNRDSVIFLAEENGSGVGFVQLYPSFSSVKMKKMWILNDLYVDVNKRGKGIGEELIKQAIVFAEETDANGLLLETGTENINAQRLYEKSGFKKESTFFYYYAI